MHLRRLMFGLMVLVVAASASARIEPLLPESSAERPSVEIEYTLVPFSSFSFVNGKLVATWDARRYRIEEVILTSDFEPAGTYAPGSAMKLAIDEGKRRYDFVGWMVDRATGERKRFITPVWTPEALPPSTDAVGETPAPLACRLDEDVTCSDGSTVRVRCSGDTGTCSSCSTGTMACCKASRVLVIPGIMGIRTVIVTATEESQPCPVAAPNPRQ